MYDPGIHTALVVDRLAPAGPGVEAALRAGHQEIQVPVGDDFLRVGFVEVLQVVLRRWVIQLVGLDCNRPVVHRNQFHLAADFLNGFLGPG